MTRTVSTPVALALACAIAAPGCGWSSAKEDPRTMLGSFKMMENSVQDLCATVLDDSYRTSGDFGTDGDRIGMALAVFMKEAAETPLAADADLVREKVNALEGLAASRAPVEQQREAARALQAAVAALKEKL
jgi:hypothetical protein